jgi:hypothetical protein
LSRVISSRWGSPAGESHNGTSGCSGICAFEAECVCSALPLKGVLAEGHFYRTFQEFQDPLKSYWRHAVIWTTRGRLIVAKYSTGCGLHAPKWRKYGHFKNPRLWINGVLNDMLVIHHLGACGRPLHYM